MSSSAGNSLGGHRRSMFSFLKAAKDAGRSGFFPFSLPLLGTLTYRSVSVPTWAKAKTPVSIQPAMYSGFHGNPRPCMLLSPSSLQVSISAWGVLMCCGFSPSIHRSFFSVTAVLGTLWRKTAVTICLFWLLAATLTTLGEQIQCWGMWGVQGDTADCTSFQHLGHASFLPHSIFVHVQNIFLFFCWSSTMLFATVLVSCMSCSKSELLSCIQHWFCQQKLNSHFDYIRHKCGLADKWDNMEQMEHLYYCTAKECQINGMRMNCGFCYWSS